MTLVKFGAQADEELLKEIRALADKENAKLYAIINEAFKDLLEKRRQEKPRKTVMESFAAGLEEYDALYERLAR